MNVDEALAVADDLENHDSADYPKACVVLAAEVRRLRSEADTWRSSAREWESWATRRDAELDAMRRRAQRVREIHHPDSEWARAVDLILGDQP